MDAAQTLHRGLPYSQIYSIRNTDRAVGAALSGELTRLSGRQGLAENFLSLTFIGSAGQSFGAFLSAGLSFTLIGEANDYVGKGMGGGEIVVFPSENACYEWSKNVIAGNTVLYGATGGSLFIAGRAGEWFAVRNSGAQAVVERIGDHGCEYMTGGTVVVLGLAGRNFGAGMTGGRGFVLDEERTFADRYNPELVHLEAVSVGEASEGLQTMIKAHAVKTGSPKAWAILTDWESYGPLFWLVSSRDPISVSVPLAAGMGTRQRSWKAYKPIPLLEQSDITEAYAAFLKKTGLQDIRADVQIRLTAPGDYDQILEHISVHRWFLGEARHEYIKYQEAVMSWIEQVYLPRIQAIHQHGIQQEFPDRTEADLYLWIPEHRPELVP